MDPGNQFAHPLSGFQSRTSSGAFPTCHGFVDFECTLAEQCYYVRKLGHAEFSHFVECLAEPLAMQKQYNKEGQRDKCRPHPAEKDGAGITGPATRR